MHIQSILRHWFTLAATAATGWLIALAILSPEEQATMQAAVSDLLGPLVVLGTLVVTALWRVLLAWAGKILAGKKGGSLERLLPVFVMVVTAGALMAALPSCTALSNIPLSVGYETPDGAVRYSSKGGLMVDWRAAK